LLLIDRVPGPSGLAVHRVKEKVFGDVYFEKLLYVRLGCSRIVKRHNLGNAAKVPQIIANAPSLDPPGGIVRVQHELGDLKFVYDKRDDRPIVVLDQTGVGRLESWQLGEEIL